MKKFLLPMMVMFGTVFGINTVNAKELKGFEMMEGVCVSNSNNVITAVFSVTNGTDPKTINKIGSLDVTISNKGKVLTENDGKYEITYAADSSSTCADISALNTKFAATMAKPLTISAENRFAVKFTATDTDVTYSTNDLSVSVKLNDSEYYTETIKFNKTVADATRTNNFDYDKELAAELVKSLTTANGYSEVKVSNGVVTFKAEISTVGDATSKKELSFVITDKYMTDIKTGNYLYVSGYVNTTKLVEDIGKAVEAAKNAGIGKEFEMELDTADTLTKDTLTEIQKNGYVATVNQMDTTDTEKLVSSWTFDGNAMKNDDLKKVGSAAAANLDLTIASNVVEVPSGKNLELTFANNKVLPTGTIVKYNVTDVFANNDILSLYFVDGKEYKEEVSGIVVKNGFATFGLTHNSKFVLSKTGVANDIADQLGNTVGGNKAPNNAQTSDLDTVMYSTMSITSLIGITYLLVSKKRIA